MQALRDRLGAKVKDFNFDFTEDSLRKRLKRYGLPLRDSGERRKTFGTFREKFRASFPRR
jgi:hypothetical protein